jgi:ferritin-like protein
MECLLLRLGKKWAAGHDMEAAIIAAKRCNMKGQKAILNYLGEDHTEEEMINDLERLHADQINGCIYLLSLRNLVYVLAMR